MPIKAYKPTSNGRRNMTALTKEEITTSTPEKSLLAPYKKKGGRNNMGQITTRHHGGGHKRKYRVIDFKRNKDGVPGKVATIEYDPNRSANIALINYADGEKRYILGTTIHNIEMHPGKGGQLARSAGVSAQILGSEEKYVIVRLQSGEVRKFLKKCRATVGAVGNEDHGLVNYGKAGRMRWKGVRPTVRGSVMNPNDHPHGGGEGKTSIGRKAPLTPWGKKALGRNSANSRRACRFTRISWNSKAPLTPWGKKALGVKTRNSKKHSNRLIVRRRNAK